MSFEDLPSTWDDQPLTDPVLAADVVDLMVSIGDRRRGTITVLICDQDDHFGAAVAVELPPDFDRLGPTYLFETALRPVVHAVETVPGTAVILALGRPARVRLAALDEQCAHAAHQVCEAAGIRLLGFYIATKNGIHQPALGALT